MTDDLKQRLRSVGKDYDFHENALVYEAADRIEQLEAERDSFYMEYRIKCDEQTKALHIERDELKSNYLRACQTIAEMHAAAMGAAVGPMRGVVEDIADLKAERDELLRKLNEPVLLSERQELMADNPRHEGAGMKLDVVKLAKEAECHPVLATKWHNGHWRCTNANLERFAALVIEECAKLLETDDAEFYNLDFHARMIRAMKEPE